MAESLNELAANAKAATPSPSPSPKAQPPVARGDELISKANAAADLDPDQKRYLNLFMGSKELLQQRIDEDAAYGEVVLPKMEKLYGENLANFVIDEADKLKIDYLKRSDPKFSGDQAAAWGWFNDLTLGQGMRVLKGAGKAVDWLSQKTGGAISRGDEKEVSLDERLDQIREEARLLEKAYPKSNMVGRIAAFITPGSPLKAVFNVGSKTAGSVAGPLIDRIAKNPGLLKNALQSAAALGGGAGADSFVRGAMGEEGQEFSLNRGAGEAIKSGAIAAITGFGIPYAGRGLQKAAEAAAPYAQGTIGKVQGVVEGAIEKATGVNPSALRAYNQRASALKAAYGTEKEIGDDLVDFLTSAKNSNLPEAVAANKLLPELPPVDARRMISALRSMTNPNPGQKEASVKLQEWAKWAEDRIVGSGASVDKVPAQQMRGLIDELQSFAKDAYGKESNALLSEIKNAARVGRIDLVSQAEQLGGENGKLYGQLMERAASKRKILDFVSKQLGRHPEAMEKNSERFITRLFGPNKEIVVNRMRALDEKFGTNFLEQAQDAFVAKQVGPGGVPPWITRHNTGASLFGAGTGFAMGGAPGAVAGAVASSPRVGAKLIGISDNISGVAKAMFSDTQSLQKLATMGTQPIEIRRLAQEIQTALLKDGPMSAGSVLRIAADTPYFVGLVNAFDAVQTQRQKIMAGDALQKMSDIGKPQAPASAPVY